MSVPLIIDNKLRFDKKVVLVTGGSRGLGRAFSQYFAELGATVVINSLGLPDDEQPGLSAAEVTKQEIVKVGGRAEVIDAPVTRAEEIVEFAQDRCGGLDAIVHNAGIVHDRSIRKSSLEDWRDIQSVHLEAAYRLAKAAWPIFQEQATGRLLFISSAAGLYGNFGQANYSAAKLGLVGLAKALAVEGGRSNIHCNCVAPVAATRINDAILTDQQKERFKTRAIAPLVSYLCHPGCEENGSLFEAAGGWYAKVRWQRSVGTVLPNEQWTIDNLAASWAEVTGFSDSESPEHIADGVTRISNRLMS